MLDINKKLLFEEICKTINYSEKRIIFAESILQAKRFFDNYIKKNNIHKKIKFKIFCDKQSMKKNFGYIRIQIKCFSPLKKIRNNANRRPTTS
jgi:hypothetical protein